MIRVIQFGEGDAIFLLFLVCSGLLDMHCSGSLIESPTSLKSIVFRTDHQKSCEGEGGEFSSRMKFPLYEFFRPLREYFLALLGVHEYFSFNFPLRE